MKKLALIFITFFGIHTYVSAQCIKRSGDFTANSPNENTYPISGTANITIDENGDMSVNFEDNFVSVQGFELKVFLSKTETINTRVPDPDVYIRVDQTGDLVCDEHQSFERSHNEEDMTALFPKKFEQNLLGVDINEYKYVILQCTEFHVPWGFAELGEVTSIDCNILNIAEKELAGIGIAQNPVKDDINITNPNQKELEIRIFDTVGNLVASQVGKSQENRFDVSTFATGLYVVELTSGSQRKAQQLVIR